MRSLPAVLLMLLVSCDRLHPERNPSAFNGGPTASLVNDAEFAYLMHHATIEAEDDHRGGTSDDHNVHFRIHGLTQQGSCVDGCPPSTLYVSSSDYYGFRDGHVRLCRIDGCVSTPMFALRVTVLRLLREKHSSSLTFDQIRRLTVQSPTKLSSPKTPARLLRRRQVGPNNSLKPTRIVASATCLRYASTRPPPRCGAA